MPSNVLNADISADLMTRAKAKRDIKRTVHQSLTAIREILTIFRHVRFNFVGEKQDIELLRRQHITTVDKAVQRLQEEDKRDESQLLGETVKCAIRALLFKEHIKTEKVQRIFETQAAALSRVYSSTWVC
jgi:hypothetical protein